jgi:hypothetical protein
VTPSSGSPIGSLVGSAMSLSPTRTMWTHWWRPLQIGALSTGRITRAPLADARCTGRRPALTCVPYACRCRGSRIRAETASLGCSHERRMDHRERMRGASGPHSAIVSPEAARVGRVEFSGRVSAHPLCQTLASHHRGFFGSWHLALRVDFGRKRMETYAAQ